MTWDAAKAGQRLQPWLWLLRPSCASRAPRRQTDESCFASTFFPPAAV